ncbi:hypothetical protein [Demequina sp. NBRC 110056]|uniref:hypothetical protein n=1 Tax=Demequina sp. NBRC 110056 TaxID=1570345 RepID=UPI0009FD5654|nr:hypothetical protein [Demequina sp. NBRC 110056]
MVELVCVALGAILGYGVVKTHPSVNGGVITGVLAGALGAWLGMRWFHGLFDTVLSQSPALVAGAAVGAMGLALLAGIGVVQLRAYLARRA